MQRVVLGGVHNSVILKQSFLFFTCNGYNPSEEVLSPNDSQNVPEAYMEKNTVFLDCRLPVMLKNMPYSTLLTLPNMSFNGKWNMPSC